MMMKGDMMLKNPISLSQREFAIVSAGYEPDDDEIREFIVEYENWLFSVENTSSEIFDEA